MSSPPSPHNLSQPERHHERHRVDVRNLQAIPVSNERSSGSAGGVIASIAAMVLAAVFIHHAKKADAAGDHLFALTPSQLAITRIVEKRVESCLRGIAPAVGDFQHELRPILGRTAEKVGLVCRGSLGGSRGLDFRVGSDTCYTGFHTQDGVVLEPVTSLENCSAGLEYAVHSMVKGMPLKR